MSIDIRTETNGSIKQIHITYHKLKSMLSTLTLFCLISIQIVFFGFGYLDIYYFIIQIVMSICVILIPTIFYINNKMSIEVNTITKTITPITNNSLTHREKIRVLYQEDKPKLIFKRAGLDRYELFLEITCFRFKDTVTLNLNPQLAQHTKFITQRFQYTKKDIDVIGKFLELPLYEE